ncbi:DNA recombination protein RmuC [bacterium]|nr:DNA recombination protein RmuC [bacterium]
MADFLSSFNANQWMIIVGCLCFFAGAIPMYIFRQSIHRRDRFQVGQQYQQVAERCAELGRDLVSTKASLEQSEFARMDAVEERAQLQGELVHLSDLREQLEREQAQAVILNRENAALTSELEYVRLHVEQQKQLVEKAKSDLTQEFERLSNKIFHEKHQLFKAESHQHLSHTVNPLKDKIGEFKLQIEQFYVNESADRHQLIGKIGELQQQTLKIGEDAVNLAAALKGENKIQGLWGEIILERLLEDSGLVKGREYDVQTAYKDDTGQRRNPDVVIFLPDDKHLIVDAKMSLLHYEQLVSEKDKIKAESLIKSHTDSIRQHVTSLSKKKYDDLKQINTVNFVFIFIPIDAAFITALQYSPDLFKFAYDKNIVLVSPSTLMATLRTVANLWSYHKQHQNAEKIAEQAGGIYDQFALVIDSLDDLGRQIDKTQSSYELTRKRLHTGSGNMLKRVDQLKHLGAKTKRELSKSTLKDLSSSEASAGLGSVIIQPRH